MDHSVFDKLAEPRVWDTETAFEVMKQFDAASTKRTAERKLLSSGVWPAALSTAILADESGARPVASVLEFELNEARKSRHLPLFAQLARTPSDRPVLHLNDARGARYWVPLENAELSDPGLDTAFAQLQTTLARPLRIFPHGELTRYCREHTDLAGITMGMLAYQAPLPVRPPANRRVEQSIAGRMSHIARLEAESIHIIREAVAQSERPAMLYSIGKDSSVMLHLARKAFYPARPPFPLLHVDTRWKFREMYAFRDRIAKESGMDLLVHINPEAIKKNINPFDHGSALHTTITKTEGLKQALDHHKFDLVFGGARRDEEKSRAKERVFSFRSASHRWDPKNQRPELWNLYNGAISPGESIRVFPLSNWTELDIWQYIYREDIPIVPLYFAKERPCVVRDGFIMMVDDDRLKLLEHESVRRMKVRFRTLGCYPLTGALESNAESLADVVLEVLNSRVSERQGRLIDSDSGASMERKKQEGYF